MKHKIAILSSKPLSKKMEKLRKLYNLPVEEEKKDGPIAFLVEENKSIGLLPNWPGKLKPIVIDFTSGEYEYLRKYSVGKKQILAKAIGVQAKPNYILDATMGLAKDSFYFSCLGVKVLGFERSPIIFELISDALDRAHSAEESVKKVIDKIQVKNMNFMNCLDLNIESPDVIYIDPMFPEKKKKALPSKEMQLLQNLLGDALPGEVEEILNQARRFANKRVVVKRPLTAGPVHPDFFAQFIGKSIRYDVYHAIC